MLTLTFSGVENRSNEAYKINTGVIEKYEENVPSDPLTLI